jgi:crossover junction endodeoxyribonuclease RuvC
MQDMVQTLLGLAERPRPPDAADAAAVALCHLAIAPVHDAAARPARRGLIGGRR